MEGSVQQSKFWSAAQTYTMAVICLVLGVAVGYLVRSPKLATSVPAMTTPRPAAAASGKEMPSATDMKRMAEKQAAPLLAELQNHPKDPELLAKIGRAYMAAQQYQDAKPYYEQSIAVKATPETLNELSFVYYSTGAVDQAIETLHSALKMDPKNPKFLYNLGMFEWHGKSDPKAAIAAWQTFVKDNPKDPKRVQVEQMIAQAKQHLNIAPGTKTDKPTM